MLNSQTKAEWFKGWEWASTKVSDPQRNITLADVESELRDYANCTLRFTAWQCGYIAGLASSIGYCSLWAF